MPVVQARDGIALLGERTIECGQQALITTIPGAAVNHENERLRVLGVVSLIHIQLQLLLSLDRVNVLADVDAICFRPAEKREN